MSTDWGFRFVMEVPQIPSHYPSSHRIHGAAKYMVCHGSHQYTPVMLAYIPAPLGSVMGFSVWRYWKPWWRLGIPQITSPPVYPISPPSHANLLKLKVTSPDVKKWIVAVSHDITSGKLTVCYWTWPFSLLVYPLNTVNFHQIMRHLLGCFWGEIFFEVLGGPSPDANHGAGICTPT